MCAEADLLLVFAIAEVAEASLIVQSAVDKLFSTPFCAADKQLSLSAVEPNGSATLQHALLQTSADQCRPLKALAECVQTTA